MNRIGFTVVIVTLGLAPLVSAQDPASGRFGNAAGCVRENASRLPGEVYCGETPRDEVVITHEVQLTTTLTTPEVVITDCQAEISLEYSQRGAIARVEGTIENTMCPASSGTFVVSVRAVNENGEAVTQEHPESWERSDDQPITFSADYEIGANVDLARVRTLRSRCKCTASAE